MTALFEPVSDPTPYPATAKSPGDQDEGLPRRLRAGGPHHCGRRCRDETTSCSTAKHASTRNSSICHDKIPTVEIGSPADCNLENIRASVHGQVCFRFKAEV